MSQDFELKVLALISRLSMEIEQLKEEVELLKKGQFQEAVPEQSAEIADAGKISVSSAREYLKKQIGASYPNLSFTHGSRVLKTKFTISDGNHKIHTLIRTSKSHREQERYASGWFVLKKDLLSEYPITFFVVEDFDGGYHTLVVPKEELLVWASHKNPDVNGNVHFYVNLIGGRIIDDRDGLDYDCTRFYNNWSAIPAVLDIQS